MKTYEGLFILPPEAAPEVRKNQLKVLEDQIKKCGGNVLQKIETGKKPLGYPLRKFREGYLVVVDFEMPSPRAPELQKTLPLQEEILKFMITLKSTKIPKNPPVKPAPAAAPKTHAASPAGGRTSASTGPQTVPTHT